MSIYHKLFFLAFISTAFFFTACGDDDVVVDGDEELITTVTLTLQPASGGATQTVTFSDPDGDGGNSPSIDTLALDTNTVYNVSVSFLNESETPVEDITEEIMEEDEEHQLFYAISSGLDMSITYEDEDSNGNPLGLMTQFTTNSADAGALTLTLLHKPDKNADGVAEGNPTNAGGETDIEIIFPVLIE